MGYLQQPIETNAQRLALVQPWLGALLAERPTLPDSEFPLEAAEREGVLPWLAWRLHESGLLGRLGGQETAVRAVLSRCAAAHMFSEQEMMRVLGAAKQAGLEFVAIKGHAVGRTLYPNPACRPTTDVDVLVAPEQVAAARALLLQLGYTPFNRYLGRYWLAGQMWFLHEGERALHGLDLHWDITNRMYFRHRASPGELIRSAPRVPCGEHMLKVTDLADSAVIACVHLAAFDPGLTVSMRWLLDIRLLLAAIAAGDVRGFVERAGEWQAVEACLVFGEAAARLDNAPALEPVLEALRAAASEDRMAEYDRTLRSRGYDLWRHWLRLGVGGKVGVFGDLVRKVLRK